MEVCGLVDAGQFPGAASLSIKMDIWCQDLPDATTLLHFRHLLEEKGIGKLLFDAINRCLEGAGRMMRGGSIVDATLISAPSSTKNAEKKRDPEMHSVKKGNQWDFGMKCHSFLPLNTASTAGRAGSPGFQTMPLAGSGILKTENMPYAARWSIPTGL